MIKTCLFCFLIAARAAPDDGEQHFVNAGYEFAAALKNINANMDSSLGNAIGKVLGGDREEIRHDLSLPGEDIGGLDGGAGEFDCDHLWEAPCPDGWKGLRGEHCEAPLSYDGPCRRLQATASLGILGKQALARSCKAPWPCAGQCPDGRNYDGVCPDDWAHVGGGFCEAPDHAPRECQGRYDFANMDINVKQEFARACAAHWPCGETCISDYDRRCPRGWAVFPDVCLAPATYAGGCGFVVNTTMSYQEKEEFADRCKAPWPCVAESGAGGNGSFVTESDGARDGRGAAWQARAAHVGEGGDGNARAPLGVASGEFSEAWPAVDEGFSQS